ncbi:MAG: virulence RhuM family protein [Bacteroidales bacterium]|nr:virulence RhuM family protein [Bacteroidales bacterium]
MENQEMIIYNTDDGKTSVMLLAKDGNVWMNQQQLAELFDTSKQNVSLHIINILKERELDDNSVVKDYLTTASDGKEYSITFYSLDMILAIGFRVRSKRGTQFRRWANQNLKEYMIKGFVIDDERLKNSSIITFNKKNLLVGKGSISNEQMEKTIDEIYKKFHDQRKQAELQQADAEDLEELKLLEEKIKAASLISPEKSGSE